MAERQPDLPFVPPLWRRVRPGQMGADILYVVLMSVAWTAGNVLAVLGTVVAAFLIVAHGRFGVFMSHLDNLVSRYVVASAPAKDRFEHEVLWVVGIATALLFAVRLPRFVLRLRAELRGDV
ncbi:hypothetical protein [Sphingomonas oryzagri]